MIDPLTLVLAAASQVASPWMLLLVLPLLRHLPWHALLAGADPDARDRRRRPDRSKPTQRVEPRLTALSGCGITPRAVLNGEERAMAARLDALLSEAEGRYRLLAQVSMDEFLEVTGGDQRARFGLRGRFAQKRVDFLIVDRGTMPVVAIEYQGSGHHRGDSAQRDATKAEILSRAGIPLQAVPYRANWPREVEALRAILGLEGPAEPTV
jgi:hypothetical protein